MALHKLIKNQAIRIDNHSRGTGIPNDWDKTRSDIHIHKTVNGSNKYEIKVPLNSNQKVSVFVNGKKNEKGMNAVPRKIRKEIEDALNDSETRDKFFTDVIKSLRDYNWPGSMSEDGKELVRKIAQAFDLDTDRIRYIWREYPSRSIIGLLIDCDNNRYRITINENYFRIGQQCPRKQENRR